MKSVLSCSIACLVLISSHHSVACSPEDARDKAWQLALTANQLGGQQLEQIERFAEELADIQQQTPAVEWENSCQVYDLRLAEFETAKQRLKL